MGINTANGVQGKITTAVAHRLTLAGDWPADITATLDGAAVPITLIGRELTVDIPSGSHTVDVGGGKP